jgi:hypothetical protein
MNKATFHSLSESEQALVVQTERAHLLTLDEEELGDLLDRVRKARNKFTKLYRRQASAQVEAKAARGKVSLGGRRDASKAEVFEEALSRVSAQLAKVARQSAAELKAERIAAARGDAGAPAAVAPLPEPATPAPKAPRSRARTPIERKTAAATTSSGRRTQAKRDTR